MECLKIYPKHEGVKNMIEVLDKEIVNLKKIDDICENIKEAKQRRDWQTNRFSTRRIKVSPKVSVS